MKTILSAFLCWTCYLSAVGISPEENLTILESTNGMKVWFKPYALPNQMISCRVITKMPLRQFHGSFL